MELKVSSLAERPEMRERVLGMANSWPEFVTQDPVGNAHYGRISDELPEYVLFAEDERGEVVAHAHSVPFALHTEERGELPARGWDETLVWAFGDLRRGVRPDTVSAISVVVDPRAQGRGLVAALVALLGPGLTPRQRRRSLAAAAGGAVFVDPGACGDAPDDDDPHDGAQRDLALHAHDCVPLRRGDRRPSGGRSFAGSIRPEPVNRVNTVHKSGDVHGREAVDLAHVGMLGVTGGPQGWRGRRGERAGAGQRD
ncbi:hypothetical protein [Streptomyces shaanxiensis]